MKYRELFIEEIPTLNPPGVRFSVHLEKTEDSVLFREVPKVIERLPGETGLAYVTRAVVTETIKNDRREAAILKMVKALEELEKWSDEPDIAKDALEVWRKVSK